MNNSSNQEKKAILLEFISADDIYICVNAKHDMALLPKNLRNNNDLRLVLSLKFVNKPSFHDDCIEAILLFGGVPRKCVIPYEAVWGVYSNDMKRLYFWQEHMPEEVVRKIGRFQEGQQAAEGSNQSKEAAMPNSGSPLPERKQEVASEVPPQPERKRNKPAFTVIGNKKAPQTEKDTSTKRSRTHLTVLK